MSVLIVEPDHDLLELMALSVGDCPARLATRGDEALLELLDAPPLVVVLELDLAGLSGERLAARARALPEPPLVVLTSADHERLMRAARPGDRILPKPFDMSLLEAAVSEGCTPREAVTA